MDSIKDKKLIFYDFEVYANFWVGVFSTFPTNPKVDENKNMWLVITTRDDLMKLYDKCKDDYIFVGYNNNHYDKYIFKSILLGINPKFTNDKIIKEKVQGIKINSDFNNIQMYNYDCLINMSTSLKKAEGNLGLDIVECSVPFDLDRQLTKEEIEEVVSYCKYDVYGTYKVFKYNYAKFQGHLELLDVYKLPHYNIGKSDTQLASIILGATNKYDKYDEFDIPIIDKIDILPIIGKEVIENIYKFYTTIKDYKQSMTVNLGNLPVTLAWGGLHGALKNVNISSKCLLIDVKAYYPTLIVKYNLLSRNATHPEKYIESYRMKDECASNDPRRGVYKLFNNTTYGASGYIYSPLYDKRNQNAVCVNGQLMLIDLSSRLLPFCEIQQVNTDGILVKYDNDTQLSIIKKIVSEWENRLELTMSYDYIDRLVQKDVNNYLIRLDNGKLKTVGKQLKKRDIVNYQYNIVRQAIIDKLLYDIDIEYTINNYHKAIDFMQVCSVSSKYKAFYYGEKEIDLKVVRVYATTDGETLTKRRTIIKNGIETLQIAKVENTPEKCTLINTDVTHMTANDIPNLDRQWYIDRAIYEYNMIVGDETE